MLTGSKVGWFRLVILSLATGTEHLVGFYPTASLALAALDAEADSLLESLYGCCTLGQPGNPESPQDCYSDYGQSRTV